MCRKGLVTEKYFGFDFVKFGTSLSVGDVTVTSLSNYEKFFRRGHCEMSLD